MTDLLVYFECHTLIKGPHLCPVSEIGSTSKAMLNHAVSGSPWVIILKRSMEVGTNEGRNDIEGDSRML